jgi:hypothetical protein
MGVVMVEIIFSYIDFELGCSFWDLHEVLERFIMKSKLSKKQTVSDDEIETMQIVEGKSLEDLEQT